MRTRAIASAQSESWLRCPTLAQIVQRPYDACGAEPQPLEHAFSFIANVDGPELLVIVPVVSFCDDFADYIAS